MCGLTQLLGKQNMTAKINLSTFAASPAGGTDPDWSRIPLDVLIENLMADHKRWREQVLPALGRLLGQRASLEKREPVFALRQAFSGLCRELLEHLHEEETILFPALLEMNRRARESHPPARPVFGSVRHPIHMIQREHEDDAEVWNTLQHMALLDATAKDAPETARILYQALTLFADDVRTHTAIENTILFPRAMEIENKAWKV